MEWGRKHRGRSPIDGLPVTVRQAMFNSQAEQVEFLRQLVEGYQSSYQIHALARDIVFRQSGCAAKDKRCQAIKIGEWVQREITYVNEGNETFQTPLHTVRLTYGDCDEFATLTASLCESLGIPCELVAMGWDPPPRGGSLPFGRALTGAWRAVLGRRQLRHIFTRALIQLPGRPLVRLPLDGTLDRPIAALTDPLVMARASGAQVFTHVL